MCGRGVGLGELLQPYITDALDAHGITVQRERTSERRTLRLRCTLASNTPPYLVKRAYDDGVGNRLWYIKRGCRNGL